MGRWIGVDYGIKRIGLAISDPEGRIATPLRTIQGTGSPAGDARAVLVLSQEETATGIVVGMPFNMDGTVGQQATLTQTFVDALRASAAGIVVETWDERLSSFQADQWIAEAQLPKGRRQAARDMLAALAILQSFLAKRQNDSGASNDPSTPRA